MSEVLDLVAGGGNAGGIFLGPGRRGGGAYWGSRSRRIARPLRAYGLLEAGVAVCALAHFYSLDAFQAVYGLLYTHLGLAQPDLLLAIKLMLSLLLVSPAAFFMGGTLPVLSAWLVGHSSALGRRVPLLYGINTAGAALGTLCAAFLLPQWLGYDLTYALAVALVASVGLTSWLIGGRSMPMGQADANGRERPVHLSMSWLRALAFLSGFVTLGLEVMGTRMFSQVLQNSVDSYAIILVIFLIALATGSFVASRLARRRVDVSATLFVLLVGAALLVALTPQLFDRITDGPPTWVPDRIGIITSGRFSRARLSCSPRRRSFWGCSSRIFGSLPRRMTNPRARRSVGRSRATRWGRSWARWRPDSYYWNGSGFGGPFS